MATIAFRRVVISAGLFDELTHRFAAGESFVIVGPRYGLKSWVIRTIAARLNAGGVDIISVDCGSELSLTQDELVARLLQSSPAYSKVDSVDAFFDVAQSEAARQQRPIVLAIYNIDGLEHTALRALLRGVRKGSSAQWLSVAITAESHFFGTLDGPDSEFNCGNEFILQGMERSLFVREAEKWTTGLGVRFADPSACFEAAHAMTGGSLSVFRSLLHSILDKSLSDVRSRVKSVSSADLEGHFAVLAGAGAHPATEFRHPGDLVASNPDCWPSLLKLLRGERTTIESPEPHFLELAGVAVVRNGEMTFSSPLMRRFLTQAFRLRRLGDLEALSGNFRGAFSNYRLTPSGPRPNSLHDVLVVASIIRRLLQVLDGLSLEDLISYLRNAAELLLGFGHTAFVEYDQNNRWEILPEGVDDIPTETRAALQRLQPVPGSSILLGTDMRTAYGTAIVLPAVTPTPSALIVLLVWDSRAERIGSKRLEFLLELCDGFLSALRRASARRVEAVLPEAGRWSSREIVECMRPDGWSGLYVVGTFDRRITFYTQQVRSLSLIRALFEIKDLDRGSRIAVVGAGSAGITAAIAASRKGCNVTIFEERDAILPMQAAASHRFLHPNIYDWPNAGSSNVEARLPFLSWSANYEDKVIKDLRREFEDRRNGIELCTASRITQILRGYEANRIRVIGNEGLIDRGFHAVVLAVGFGIEIGNADARSYWSGDSLDGPFEHLQHILISGSGDGGLIDVARATLRTSSADNVFRHDEAVEWLSHDTQFWKLGKQMQEVDVAAQNAEIRNSRPLNLYQEYSTLQIPDSLLLRVKSLKRSDTAVTFNYRKPGVFSLDSSLLNRMLVFLLLRARVIQPKLGEARLEAPTIGGVRRVNFIGPPSSSGEFDIAIFRHGTPADGFANAFPDLYPACHDLGGKLASLRLTGHLNDDTQTWHANST